MDSPRALRPGVLDPAVERGMVLMATLRMMCSALSAQHRSAADGTQPSVTLAHLPTDR